MFGLTEMWLVLWQAKLGQCAAMHCKGEERLTTTAAPLPDLVSLSSRRVLRGATEDYTNIYQQR